MLSSALKAGICACALAVFSLAGHANADVIIFGTHTDHPLVPGADLMNVALSVDLSASGGVATMTFTNVSTAPELSAAFKLIVIDTLDDDTATAILWDGSILTTPPGVAYSLEPYNVLPGYNPVITDGGSMVQLQADPAPPKEGIGPGETLQVQFSTSLPDGADIFSYFAAFDGGDDTGAYSLGFHAISADVVDGESLSGVITITEVPEPAALSLMLVGGAVMLARRRRNR